MSETKQRTTLFEGQHLSLVQRDHWEYVQRHTGKPAVGVVALTDQDQIILVEQFRPPIDRRIVELPAGLAGDIPGAEDEELLRAAQRELWEETGYTAQRWTPLVHAYSSAGLTDESIELFLAEGLNKEGVGGGVDDEEIIVHEVARDQVTQWLQEQNTYTDLKLCAGLYAAAQTIAARRSNEI